MTFHVLTLFPEFFSGPLTSSILGKALESDRVRVNLVNFRRYARDRHKTCDDAPYGGGAGMVLKPAPLFAALEDLEARSKRVVFPSPSGRKLDQEYVRRLSCLREMVIVCGHYEGVDQRVLDRYVTDEVSLGDYVLFSGEAACLVLLEAVVRLTGVIREESVSEESFENGLLEYPHYTRPACIEDMTVPDVLLSGNHERIRRWRLRRSVEKTMENRPDLLRDSNLAPEVRKLIEEMNREGDT